MQLYNSYLKFEYYGFVELFILIIIMLRLLN